MKLLPVKFSISACLLLACSGLPAQDVELKIKKKYLNFPVSHGQERSRMTFRIDGTDETPVKIRLAPAEADYWVFRNVEALKGKTIRISYEGDEAGLANIYQSDEFAGQDSLYREQNRPQYHFTTQRGWINDPNGLVYHNGEYHLFYQHNPYEREWENMHWGHAVTRDFVHWEELQEALIPDHLGTMFSGSAVIDYDNTSGFGTKKTPAMVAIYTADARDRQTQCIAWSLDRGRTFTKYDGNPVIDSKEMWNSRDTRDPKVFWYAPGGHWVMVLNERDGHSIYTSANLKEWIYQSHTAGFWECPELFELAVDGNPDNTLWVMYGATGTYMLGTFDGKTFTPLHGKYLYTTGSIYAAQTITGMPDGRRVQIGWGRISHPGMPFNGMMMLPTELTLRTTKDGPRLFSEPVKETEQLFRIVAGVGHKTCDEANKVLNGYFHGDCLRINTTIKLSHATNAGLNLNGQKLLNYDLNSTTVNGVFYSPEDMTSTEITADIYIDRTSIEVFIDGGAYSYSMERRADPKNTEGFRFRGNNIEIVNLEVFGVKPIW